MTDPIADMLTRIRNGVNAKQAKIDMPASKLKAEVARILVEEGYLHGFKVLDEKTEHGSPRKAIRLFLKYGPHGERVITGVQRCEPARAPRLFRSRRRPDRAWWPRHEHPHHLARRHEWPRGRQGRRGRRSALQRLVVES
jgi:ribosomal protein S8